jgi:hypothetical protein
MPPTPTKPQVAVNVVGEVCAALWLGTILLGFVVVIATGGK